MKKTFLFAAALLLFAGFTSCTKDDDKGGEQTPVDPIESVTAVDGSQIATATISHENKTIDFGQFKELIDISKVQVTFKLAKGVVMKSPATTEATVSLINPLTVTVNDGTKDISYTMTGTGQDIPDPVISAKAGGVDATIEGRDITIAYADGMDASALALTLDLQDGATVTSPDPLTFDLEFAESAEVVVNYFDTDYTYTVKLSGYQNPFIAHGWSDVTADYGQVPDYIKVYKIPAINGLEGEVGYVVLLLPGATMGIVGGADNPMTVAEAVKGYDYTVYFATSSTTIPTMVNDGVVVAESNYSQPMLAQDADGNFSFEIGQRFDSQFYSFPFRKGASNNTYIPREVTDGTAWNFKSACGTFNALVWDGAVVTMNEAGSNSSYCSWMGDGSKNARAGIGVLKSGKPFLFNTQGAVSGVIDCKGQTHEDVAAELIAAGCDRAGVVEGSGTPSLVVNGKHTAINKNDPAGDCTGTSLKKLVGALAVK